MEELLLAVAKGLVEDKDAVKVTVELSHQMKPIHMIS